jgi:hypothetical protein
VDRDAPNHGPSPAPNVHADVSQARPQPAEDNLDRAQALSEARAQARLREQPSPAQTQGGPSLAIGARIA